jgi:Rps23 Pro-64 3,4-dihydroxylase Tpa1-like proline 4-hydroxylase
MINLEFGRQLSPTYSMANPYPHIIIDDFIESSIANTCYNEMENYKFWGWDGSKYSENHQVNKFFTPWSNENISNIQDYMPAVWKMLSYYNSRLFLNFLEELTGIKELLPDWSFTGGGCHKTTNGGRLAIHTDYQKHSENSLHRRLNMLIYLNPNWQSNWGGSLQLVDYNSKETIKNIFPKFKRMVLFNTTNKSLHGHPEPIICPEDEARYSFALYYFTKDRPTDEISTDAAAIWY